ncbi:MAG TPA: hypothetical protein VNO50_15395 [Pyrinomonadaceae bacterium]|nr:hypothetical protein [Pyrinomonadaceae bacterium]
MNKRILVPLCFVFGFLLVACGTATVNTNDPATPATKTEPASTASTPATTAVASGEKIGVPECDDFIAAYDACVTGKVPEVARAQYKASIEQWRTSWRQLAANPNTKATLAGVCKQSAEQARASMKSFDCTF